MNKTIVILGAGPAGLTAAWILSNKGYDVEVIEREPHVGGTSASFKWKEYVLDFGPHAYHAKRDGIDKIVRSLCKSDLHIKRRREKMLIKGKYFGYPLQFWEVVSGLNPFFSAYMVIDFLLTSLKNKIAPMPQDSFEDWGLKSFGRTLYDLCFGKYTSKIWGRPGSALSAKLFTQKIHRLNMKDIIIKLFGGRGTEQLTHWKDFLYPEEGIGEIFDKMKLDILNNGGKVHLNSNLIKINVKDDKVESVIYENEKKENILRCDFLLSSIPVNKMSLSVNPAFKPEVIESANKLLFRSLIIVYAVFGKSNITDAHWIYLLDEAFKFNRFCEQKNLGSNMCPKDKTVLGFEICCDKNDGLWNASNEKLYAILLEDIAKFDIMRKSDIVDFHVTKIDEAYPIYDLEFDKNLKNVMDSIGGITNLISFGRQGLFLNNDIHDSMEMGIMVAGFLEDPSKTPLECYKELDLYARNKLTPKK